MTLIVGIKCTDGIVVGADGAATLNTTLGQFTVRQPVKKLVSIKDSLVVGCSGPVGLAQIVQHKIEKLWDGGGLRGKSAIDGMSIVRDTIRPSLINELQSATQIRSSAMGEVAMQGAICATLVAVNLSRAPCLFQFNFQGSPEAATDNLPFVSLGSGQPIADPFLAFLRRIFWRNRLPSLSEGILATLWSLRHAIETNPGGVSEPIQILTLGSSGGVHELDRDELAEQEQAILAAERALAQFGNELRTGDAEAPPTANHP